MDRLLTLAHMPLPSVDEELSVTMTWQVIHTGGMAINTDPGKRGRGDITQCVVNLKRRGLVGVCHSHVRVFRK